MMKTKRVSWKPRVWIQWLHRWATLTLGLLLLVVTTTGAIALFRFELTRLSYPQFYQVTTGPRITLDQARAAAVRGLAADPDPDFRSAHIADVIERPDDVIQIYVRDDDGLTIGSVFVDPGSGDYLGHFKSEHSLWNQIAELHYTLFSDEILFTYPEGTPEWLSAWLGPNLAEFMLKHIALVLLIMVLTGAYLWWPGIRRWTYGFRIRPRATGFTWHYDWHKVLGFVSLPFLFMWAVTGLNFYPPFTEPIGQTWAALTFSAPVAAADAHASTPTGGPMLSLEQARAIAQGAVPDGRVVSVSLPAEPDGLISIWVAHGLDSYAYGEWPGNVLVELDAYSGEVLHNSLHDSASWGADVYANWFGPIHFGLPVHWSIRLIWAFFGLMPLFLAVTGFMQWWLKRTRAATRASRAAARVAAAEL